MVNAMQEEAQVAQLLPLKKTDFKIPVPMAMEGATNSAKQMLKELDIEYNRARQAAITQEITEVIAGAKSQKKKKK